MLSVKLRFLRFVLANRDLFTEAEYALPGFSPEGVPSPGAIDFRLRYWTSIVWSEKFVRIISRIVMFLDCTGCRSFKSRLQFFMSHPPLIHAIRVTSHIFISMFVPNLPAASHPIVKACNWILEAFKPCKNSSNIHMTNFLHKKRVRHLNTVPSFTRYTFFHKFLTPTKRQISKKLNNLMTERWEMADDERTCHLKVEPGPNYALQVATMDFCVNRATDLSITDLFRLVHFVSEKAEETNDKDILHLLIQLNSCLRSRFKVKTIELNLRDCTCQTKCCGMVGQYPLLDSTSS